MTVEKEDWGCRWARFYMRPPWENQPFMSCENDGMLFCPACDGQNSVFSASFDVSWGVYMRKEIVWASWAIPNGHQKSSSPFQKVISKRLKKWRWLFGMTNRLSHRHVTRRSGACDQRWRMNGAAVANQRGIILRFANRGLSHWTEGSGIWRSIHDYKSKSGRCEKPKPPVSNISLK